MPLSERQKADMHEKIRAYSVAGEPEKAAPVRQALENDAAYVEPEVEEVEIVPVPPMNGPGASKKAWVAYALAISDIDEEVLESVKKSDIIAMLRANGFIAMPEVSDLDDGYEFVEIGKTSHIYH